MSSTRVTADYCTGSSRIPVCRETQCLEGRTRYTFLALSLWSCFHVRNISMKRIKIDLTSSFEQLEGKKLEWRKTAAEGLDLDYAMFLPKHLADELLAQLQDTVEYYEGEFSKIKIFGKSHEIPRQQVAYGNDGMVYRFSGTRLPAKSWTPLLKSVRDLVSTASNQEYNFVLINRYRDGSDHIGEHRDDESDLDPSASIASLSLGQHRQFVFRHASSRKKGPQKINIPSIKMDLQHGSLLLMNPPTNKFWYHSLPPRKSTPGVRINLTFRKLLIN